MRSCWRLAPLCLLLAPVTMPAQRVLPLARAGDDVRIRDQRSMLHRGTLIYANRDSLALTGSDGVRRAMAASDIQVAWHRASVGVARRASYGALTGAALGAVLPLISFYAELHGSRPRCTDAPLDPKCVSWAHSMEGTPLLMSFFAMLGGGIGAAVPFHHWERVRPDAQRGAP